MIDKQKVIRYLDNLQQHKDASSTILHLGHSNILPLEFARRIVGMANFRNKLVHEYLPTEFEAERLHENLHRLHDFRQFASYITQFLEKQTEEQA